MLTSSVRQHQPEDHVRVLSRSRSHLARLGGLALTASAVLTVTTASPAQASSDMLVGVVDGCASTGIKTSIWGRWQQHTACESVTALSTSPDGQYIGVVNANGSLSIKQGLWGTWQQHLGPGDSRHVALGPSGMVGAVSGCGAAIVKTSLWGQWQQHTPCNSVTAISISPDGQYFGVINANGSLSIKQGLWGTWQQHLGPGDTRDVDLGPSGMVGAVSGCGAAIVKTSLWGQWQQHTGCSSVTKVQVSPDGQNVGVINSDGSVSIKQGVWGNWHVHTGGGNRDLVLATPNTSSTARKLLMPASGPITSPYGDRRHPVTGEWTKHTGIDIGASYGAAVVAAEGGQVAFSGTNGGYGNYICVAHPGDLTTCYAHLAERRVGVGHSVGRGQLIGLVGSTGTSTGPHLHFETKLRGVFVDPMQYL